MLAAFPVVTAVLAAFGQRVHGAQHATAVLRGLLLGMLSFVAFYAVLELTLRARRRRRRIHGGEWRFTRHAGADGGRARPARCSCEALVRTDEEHNERLAEGVRQIPILADRAERRLGARSHSSGWRARTHPLPSWLRLDERRLCRHRSPRSLRRPPVRRSRCPTRWKRSNFTRSITATAVSGSAPGRVLSFVDIEGNVAPVRHKVRTGVRRAEHLALVSEPPSRPGRAPRRDSRLRSFPDVFQSALDVEGNRRFPGDFQRRSSRDPAESA
jgi:hypothetical protein